MPYNELEVKFANFDQQAKNIEEETNFRNATEVITPILKVINCLLQLTPALRLPPFLTYFGALRRSGVLSDTIVANIFNRLADDGVNVVGTLPDGSPNVMQNVIQTVVDELITQLVLNNSVQSEIPIGGITIGPYFNTTPVQVLGFLK